MTMTCISTGPHSWFAHRADIPAPRLHQGWGISGTFHICDVDECPGGADCPPSHRQPHLDAMRVMMARTDCPTEIIDAMVARSAARPSVKAGGGCCGGSCSR
jgi:hypothetical protein